ncbi:hypothetical protein [Microbacterium sp. Bi128]|uniref:hypothetical protein n=1 Tax=Microbacterium sp. Bi128 TaxID=2821115 RepID=UPI001D35D1CB|nr:hypothetical protein [Microbacterium sp. Bi128]CAH0225769.1 hypothetical protein SRABI128_02312 [Microbacterium sp. Bi128]
MLDMTALWSGALAGNVAPLELALVAGSRLPGPRANLELAAQFADTVARTAVENRPGALALLDDWLALPARFVAAIPEEVSEYLPACAALAAGSLDARALLTHAASDHRWRVRELAATGMQRVLTVGWGAGMQTVDDWLRSGDPLLIRAAVAAVAEPRLMRDAAHAAQAYEVVLQATDALLAARPELRRADDVRVLRAALGYGISVITVGHPDACIDLLQQLAASDDADARWIAKENLRKARLRPFADRLADARRAVGLS